MPPKKSPLRTVSSIAHIGLSQVTGVVGRLEINLWKDVSVRKCCKVVTMT